MLTYGVVQRSMLGVPVSITSPARTVVGCFRYRNKVGIDLALEALRDAARSKITSVDEIVRAAEVCRAHGDADLPGGTCAMNRPPRNLAASIHQRLLNGARERREDPQFILQRYVAERFLYWLGESPHREQFVLKGAMLFALWGGSVYRPTRDLDFAGYCSDEIEAVRARIRDICAVPAPVDGMSFDATTLRAEPIREEVEYGGVRIVFEARLGSAQVRMQIDVGFGNAIEPRAPTPTTRRSSTRPPRASVPTRRRPWSPRSSTRWSCSARATAATRTSTASTSWRGSSHSMAQRSRGRSPRPSSAAARRRAPRRPRAPFLR